jgi:hypothetical protein
LDGASDLTNYGGFGGTASVIGAALQTNPGCCSSGGIDGPCSKHTHGGIP